ncbi:hypothetical protein AB1L05_10340 [Cytobacillus horneckiae]
MTIESNYALNLKHSMDYMTNLTSGGLRVNANNTGLILKEQPDTIQTKGSNAADFLQNQIGAKGKKNLHRLKKANK